MCAITNRTVITAVDQGSMKERVFTNIEWRLQSDWVLNAGGMFEQAGRRVRIAADRRPATAIDAGLLEADRLAGIAEIGLMVEIDAGHHGAVGIPQIHRIEATAQPHFKNGDVDPGFVELRTRLLAVAAVGDEQRVVATHEQHRGGTREPGEVPDVGELGHEGLSKSSFFILE